MSENIFKLCNLTKSYKGNIVLKNINLSIEKGKIYGLIGQNGAGKTTLMRILLGITFPTSGEILLYNEEANKFEAAGQKKLEKFREEIGSLVEHPSVYPEMTASENMQVLCKVCGIKNDKRVDDLLIQVGLGDTGNKKVRNFSLGMKQRLAIALALINSPKILILDEPINGLDPLGIYEVRNLLIKISEEENITIIISSHILTELYQLATDYIFLDAGTILETVTQEHLIQKIEADGNDLENYYFKMLKINQNQNDEVK